MNKFIATILLLLIMPNVSFGESSMAVQSKESAWFLPSLVTNKHEVCGTLLSKAQETFLSESPYSSIYYDNARHQYIPVAGMDPVEYGSDPDVIMEKIDHDNLWSTQAYHGTPSVVVGGKKIYLHPYKHPGCGGACERYQLIASGQRQPKNWGELAVSAIPSSVDYKIYKAKNGSFWSYSHDTSEGLLAYQLKETGQWELTCKIQLDPAEINSSSDPILQQATSSLSKFASSVFGLTRDEGDCGSSKAHWRWTDQFRRELPSVLYRPWAIREGVAPQFEDKVGAYDEAFAGLNDWKLMGLSEYESFSAYLSILDRAVLDIAAFYQNKFGWEKSKSESMARTGLTSLVSRTVRFGYYGPINSQEERELRQAILEQHPIEEIKSNKYEIKETGHDGGESLLSLAVLYPNALHYLLSKGLNPNHQNDFGKTPLIYAVQYNQPESVRMLLEAGADPNVKTTKPVNTCFYTIRTFNMTPLHYAVRYASPEIIRMLLDDGAATFIKADNQRDDSQDTALDWLLVYTNPFEEEKNPNMPDAMIKTVKEWVKPANLETSPDIANKYVLQAEELYQQKRVPKSYQMLGLALELQPDNERALSDMSLIALKNGKLGQSTEAGERLIKQSKSDKLKANAWYNQGLACERYASNRPSDYFGYKYLLNYNGKNYCGYDAVFPFYKAVKTNSTKARMEKLIEIFEQPSDNYCDIPEKGIKIRIEKPRGPDGESLYLLHDNEVTVSGEMLAWTLTNGNGQQEKFVPEKMDVIKLGDKTLSVFSSKRDVSFPYDILGYRCTQGGKPTAVKLK